MQKFNSIIIQFTFMFFFLTFPLPQILTSSFPPKPNCYSIHQKWGGGVVSSTLISSKNSSVCIIWDLNGRSKPQWWCHSSCGLCESGNTLKKWKKEREKGWVYVEENEAKDESSKLFSSSFLWKNIAKYINSCFVRSFFRPRQESIYISNYVFHYDAAENGVTFQSLFSYRLIDWFIWGVGVAEGILSWTCGVLLLLWLCPLLIRTEVVP